MRRLLPLLLIATTALAQSHHRTVTPPHLDVSANSVSGIVSSVNGTLVSLAGGLVVIDTGGANVSGEIVPGALLVAVLQPGDVAPNAPLKAAIVGVTPAAQVTLTGMVTAVDRTAGTLTLLGRTVKTNAQTTYSGLLTFAPMTLADIFPGQTVIVDANASGGALLARSVHVVQLSPPALPNVVHGTVKSIGSTAWTITAGGKDTTVSVDAFTKIVGNPNVGDTVDAIVDRSNVALAIIKTKS